MPTRKRFFLISNRYGNHFHFRDSKTIFDNLHSGRTIARSYYHIETFWHYFCHVLPMRRFRSFQIFLNMVVSALYYLCKIFVDLTWECYGNFQNYGVLTKCVVKHDIWIIAFKEVWSTKQCYNMVKFKGLNWVFSSKWGFKVKPFIKKDLSKSTTLRNDGVEKGSEEIPRSICWYLPSILATKEQWSGWFSTFFRWCSIYCE